MPNRSKGVVKTRGQKAAQRKPAKATSKKTAPLAVNNQQRSSVPRTVQTALGSVVTHSEVMVSSLTGAPDFEVVNAYAVQPALATYAKGQPMCSWLPALAANYDNYEFLELKVKFFTSVASTIGGTVMIGYDPNPEQVAPTDFTQLRNMHSVTSTARENVTFDLGPKVRGKRLLTRIGIVPSLPLYDAGRIYVATQDCVQGQKLGYIEVSYVVRLSNPQSGARVEMIPTFQEAVPLSRWESSYTSTTAINTATSMSSAMHVLASNGTFTGTGGLATVVPTTLPAIDITFGNGCKLVGATVNGSNVLRIGRPGRFRLRATINGDFEDLKLFHAVPMILRTGGWMIPTVKVPAAVGAEVGTEVSVLPQTMRGFAGTAVGDPNPGTDLSLTGRWDFDALEDDRLVISIGPRTYNAVSTTTANLTLRSDTGPRFWTLEWLGPSLA